LLTYTHSHLAVVQVILSIFREQLSLVQLVFVCTNLRVNCLCNVSVISNISCQLKLVMALMLVADAKWGNTFTLINLMWYLTS